MMNDLHNQLGYLLKRTQQALRHALDEALENLALTSPQYAALAVLELEARLSNAELARRCFVTPQTMHQILVGLEKAGLLERTPHPEHGRIQQATLSKQGQHLLRQAHKAVANVEQKMIVNLSKTEQVQMRKLLLRCSEALEHES